MKEKFAASAPPIPSITPSVRGAVTVTLYRLGRAPPPDKADLKSLIPNTAIFYLLNVIYTVPTTSLNSTPDLTPTKLSVMKLTDLAGLMKMLATN